MNHTRIDYYLINNYFHLLFFYGTISWEVFEVNNKIKVKWPLWVWLKVTVQGQGLTVLFVSLRQEQELNPATGDTLAHLVIRRLQSSNAAIHAWTTSSYREVAKPHRAPLTLDPKLHFHSEILAGCVAYSENRVSDVTLSFCECNSLFLILTGESHWALPNSHNWKNSISFPNNGSMSSPIQSAC